MNVRACFHVGGKSQDQSFSLGHMWNGAGRMEYIHASHDEEQAETLNAIEQDMFPSVTANYHAGLQEE